jgi:NADH dehydrogenase [ubiquinone] 1 alpha subcomplex assembly factor 5
MYPRQNVMLFDRTLWRARREHVAADFAKVDFLKRLAVESLLDRLLILNPNPSYVIDIGCHHGMMFRACRDAKICNLAKWIDMDAALGLVQQSDAPWRVVADEESIPICQGRMDLVLSSMSLHWVNKLPETLYKMRQLLRPGGLLVINLLGGSTLAELRQAAMQAHLQEGWPLRPLVVPMVDIKQFGMLLQEIGLSEIVVDSDPVTVHYSSLLQLAYDLRAMGENNMLVQRSKVPLSFDYLCALERYHQRSDQGFHVTFDIVNATAWAP